ncbi:MAG: alkaline phosphatase family protein, partial [Acidobacteriota bacterium]
MPRVLLVFLDGVGLGTDEPDANPFLQAHLPTISGLLGGAPPTLSAVRSEGTSGDGTADHAPHPDEDPFGDRGSSAPAGERGELRTHLVPMDACLGVDGLPQSGTGQIALLTGRNAPRLFGGHFGPWPPVRLRGILERENLLRRAVERGHQVAFANAYPAGYPEGRSPRRVAAPVLAARAAGALTRHAEALERGDAVASEIVNEGWRRHLRLPDIPPVEPRQAGRNLARIATGARLTLFAHYLTDTAGHRGGMSGAVEALERVDAFLSGVLDQLPPDLLLVVASDHGNVEDVRAEHTRNPALGLVLGRGAVRFVRRLAYRRPVCSEC